MSHGETLVVVPAYNEEDNIAEVVRRAGRHADVCVVDDGSRDRTAERAAAIPGVRLVRHAHNTHIPGALLDGMREAATHGYGHVVTMDAGLSHDPDEIPRFLEWRGRADLVMGRRESESGVPWFRRALSRGGNRLYNFALEPSPQVWRRPRFADVTSGFRLYSRRAIDVLLAADLQSRSFDFMIEALWHVHRAGLVIAEVPIAYRFTGSSLNARVVGDALRMLGRMLSVPGLRTPAAGGR
ncbi:MAG: glycosyltransferase [Proteobacteria bacterium]|nr:glycosyltransferase [Pseudomonadota bacterium]